MVSPWFKIAVTHVLTIAAFNCFFIRSRILAMCGLRFVSPASRSAASLPFRVLVVVALVLPVCSTQGVEFTPAFEKAELHGPGDLTYQRRRVERDGHARLEVAGRRLAIEKNEVHVFTGEDREQPRRFSSIDGRHLRWLGATAGIAFFAIENTEAEIHVGQHYLPAEIRRLDLTSLAWLPSWTVAPESATPPRAGAADSEARRVAVLGRLLAAGKTTIVLTYTMAEKPQWPKELTPQDAEKMMSAEHREWFKKAVYLMPLSYQVTCFASSAEQPSWSRSFSWREKESAPAMLSAGIVWGGTDVQIELLTAVGDMGEEAALLVCPGIKQELVCLATEDGRERWR
jgi:hypothetical protein